jgi:hypothetical protein
MSPVPPDAWPGGARMWGEGVGGIIDRRRIWLEANAGGLVRALTG